MFESPLWRLGMLLGKRPGHEVIGYLGAGSDG
ncbi:hypothetical protein EV192_1011193 [Actinocrispum wychmicini]|uniref:Uncharacterized protein n=1 Tax=Actinocrispum wychmicini TaxID=1213861 RepID=A0A4R2JXT1_9PSEU|nr:hypothetical protein EV192_1011193 [Actinocrispum wychmicini]